MMLSVIIPTYNRCNTIRLAIKSILENYVAGTEIIVVDDGSNDGTYEIVREWASSSPFIRYFKTENNGVSAARNVGIAMARGAYLTFLDSDDQLKSNYLSTVYRILKQNIDIIFVGVEFYMDDEFQKIVLPGSPYGKTSDEGLFLAGTFIVKSDLLKNVGGYDVNLKYSENTELSIRINAIKPKKRMIDVPLLMVNQSSKHRTSISPDNIVSSLTYLLKKHPEFYKRHLNTQWLYLNNIATAYRNMSKKSMALNYYFQAISLKPWRIISYLRVFRLLF